MSQRVYIETTIVSYLTAKPSTEVILRANQILTREWWHKHRQRYDLFVSQFVVDEARDGDQQAAARRLQAIEGIPLLDATSGTILLAEELIARRLLPPRAATDAVHLAIATVNRMDVLLTWNCRHLANAEILAEIGKFLRANGHECPVVCVPTELMGVSEQ